MLNLNYIKNFKSDRNQEVEVKEPIEEVMEMDFGMFDVVDSKPQRKLFNHNPELFIARANHRAFIKSL